MQSDVVLAWGAGEDGQLGLGDVRDKAGVCEVEALEHEQVTCVVAGSRNSLAICNDGRLFTWGWNQRGTLGHPQESKTECLPSQVKALAHVKIVQAAIGGWHCLAVDTDGRAYAWGGNEYGQCAEEPEQKDDTKVLRRDIVIPQRCAPHMRVRQVAAGGTHSVVLTYDGLVWTWGQPWPPGDIKQISTPVRVQGLENVRLIAVGAFHNLALLECGEVWAWGNNEYGQLGTGDTQPRALPVPVKGLDGLIMEDIAAGGWHSMALTPEGERISLVFGGRFPTWSVQVCYTQYRMDGNKEEGSSSEDRQPIPTAHEIGESSGQAEKALQVVSAVTMFKQLMENPRFMELIQSSSIAHQIQGSFGMPRTTFRGMQNMVPNPMYANIGMQPRFWGIQGQFGVSQGNLGMAGFSIPPVNMAPRHHHVTGQGVQMAPIGVYAWGRGEHGRLGFGDDKSSKMVPQEVSLLAEETIVQVSCGGTHSVALSAAGRMYSFGRADHGRLGCDRAVTTGHPIEVPVTLARKSSGLSNGQSSYHEGNGEQKADASDGNWSVKYIACGGRHTLALASWISSDHMQ
ncbi:hypothetical protein L7F22_018242 [Adiantum nelumboides]|nr:hypothetical protein [Adiantum nelumboides]